MTSYGSILEATTAIRTTTIPDHGRRVYYRGYLIHGEIPGVCYVIYGRNEFGQVMELGATRTFQAAMRWVDSHREQMESVVPVRAPRPASSAPSSMRAAV